MQAIMTIVSTSLLFKQERKSKYGMWNILSESFFYHSAIAFYITQLWHFPVKMFKISVDMMLFCIPLANICQCNVYVVISKNIRIG